MKAIVTGGGGFVGRAIVGQLVDKGVETAVIGRRYYPEIERLGCRIWRGDIRNESFLVHACKGYDTVFHVAAKAGIWGGQAEYETVNVAGTNNVISACLANRIDTLVYTGTPSVVFNGEDIGGGDETLPYADRFMCHYAETKARAEQRVLAANSDALKTCSLRPHLVWGPGDPHLIPRLLDRGRRGMLRQVGDGQNRVDISYVDNVAQAHLLAAENLKSTASAAGKAYFISQGEPVVLWEWVNTLFQRLDIAPVDKKIGFPMAFTLGRMLEGIYKLLRVKKEPPMTRFLAEQLAKSHWFSIERAKVDLGYRPKISTAEGSDRLVAWLKEGRGSS